jgi:hypothetical protein
MKTSKGRLATLDIGSHINAEAEVPTASNNDFEVSKTPATSREYLWTHLSRSSHALYLRSFKPEKPTIFFANPVLAHSRYFMLGARGAGKHAASRNQSTTVSRLVRWRRRAAVSRAFSACVLVIPYGPCPLVCPMQWPRVTRCGFLVSL